MVSIFQSIKRIQLQAEANIPLRTFNGFFGIINSTNFSDL